MSAGAKEDIDTLKTYIKDLVQNMSETEANLSYYRSIIADLGTKDDLPESYLDSNLLISKVTRDTMRPLFRKVIEINRIINVSERCKSARK